MYLGKFLCKAYIEFTDCYKFFLLCALQLKISWKMHLHILLLSIPIYKVLFLQMPSHIKQFYHMFTTNHYYEN